VAEMRRKAEKKLVKLKQKRQSVSPVMIVGRAIAKSFLGKSWCTNLERYSDYENRLPRGRTYVRNGSVVDLQLAKGKVSAMVSGSDLYTVTITIAPVTATRWKAICRDCAGTIDSLVELLRGRLSKGVMDRVCREGDGLFPAPKEIKLSCSCPDWADMCKHVAAALYSVGARLDEKPALLFERNMEKQTMSVTVLIQAPANSGVGGEITGLPSGTILVPNSSGQVVAQQQDVATLQGLGFVVAPQGQATGSTYNTNAATSAATTGPTSGTCWICASLAFIRASSEPKCRRSASAVALSQFTLLR